MISDVTLIQTVLVECYWLHDLEKRNPKNHLNLDKDMFYLILQAALPVCVFSFSAVRLELTTHCLFFKCRIKLCFFFVASLSQTYERATPQT